MVCSRAFWSGKIYIVINQTPVIVRLKSRGQMMKDGGMSTDVKSFVSNGSRRPAVETETYLPCKFVTLSSQDFASPKALAEN